MSLECSSKAFFYLAAGPGEVYNEMGIVFRIGEGLREGRLANAARSLNQESSPPLRACLPFKQLFIALSPEHMLYPPTLTQLFVRSQHAMGTTFC